MGIREIRFCDITGSEQDVAPHELQIDQMHLEIDLAETEYRKLLETLAPYMEAGRVEASAPATASLPQRRPAPGQGPPRKLTAGERAQLRRWADERDILVPANNRFKASLIEQWRRETAAGAP